MHARFVFPTSRFNLEVVTVHTQACVAGSRSLYRQVSYTHRFLRCLHELLQTRCTPLGEAIVISELLLALNLDLNAVQR